MHSSVLTLAVVAAAVGSSNASPLLSRNLLTSPLAANADETERAYQPFTDFDTDGCYFTAAIDTNGNTNPGITDATFKNPQDGCRDSDRLRYSNVYSRKRCNNGWCAIMYEYYFEKDQAVWGSFLGGHTHDWENIVVFVQNGAVKRVAPSCHGKYDNASNSPRLDGNRAKMVYHKDGVGTHCWRHANAGDDAVENSTGAWFLGALVGWNGWPAINGQLLRDRVFLAWQSGIAPKLWDYQDSFTNNLRAAAGNGAPGFDPALDG